MMLSNEVAQPTRDAQPEAGINAALGEAFNTSGGSNAGSRWPEPL